MTLRRGRAGRSKTNALGLVKQDQRRRALQLRRQGFTYPEIAEELGVSTRTAKRAVDVGLQDYMLPVAEEARVYELERLNHLYSKLEPKIDKGDEKAIRIASQLIELRCKIQGLLVVKVENSSSNGAPAVFVVQVPVPAASVEAWQAQARHVLDVTPEPLEIIDATK
ncbi:MAG TPA: helix-turn-helix domain-containing protein [Holophagaceae bacterium]|nr:helix-turn-helix domain-containing protein [Holophagaceae bacterium]